MSSRILSIYLAFLLVGSFLGLGCGGDDPDPLEEDPAPCSADEPDGACDEGAQCYNGTCRDDSFFCSDQRPSGLCSLDGDVCLDGVCVDGSDVCSDENPSGLCPVGVQCLNGSCSTDEPCGPTEPQGYCDADGEICLDGECTVEDDTCSADNPGGICPGDEECDQGVCIPDTTCSADNPTGECPSGQFCDEGSCVVDPDDECSADNPTGGCPTGEVCDDGMCMDDPALCSVDNLTGECPTGEICDEGICVDEPSDECSAQNPTGTCPAGQQCVSGVCEEPATTCDCAADEICVDGQCRAEDLTCSVDNPTGLCESGFNCIEGNCINSGAECSASNPAGVCPIGEWCNGGTCEDIDGVGLCDDANSCTENSFNPATNRCEAVPVDNSCTDGNGCTANWCEDGMCMSEPVAGCVEPPFIEPWESPTNDGTLQLFGTKPAGSAIEIDGQTAVSESPDTDWTVTLNLDPGENIFEVRSIEGATASEIREVVVVYDNINPITSITPEGGIFLNGITVQVTTNEPATVYYTTDGSIPNQWSSSFQSVREFRIFEPTRLKFLAQDPAGNWEDEVVEADFEIISYANRWSDGPALGSAVINPGIAELDDMIYVAGGSSGASSQVGVYGYDIAQEAWSTLPSLPQGRNHLAMVALDGELYAIGGEDDGTSLNIVTRFNPSTDAEWTSRQGLPTTRHGLSAIAYEDEIFAFGGKSGGDLVRDTLEVYTPGDNTWTNQVAQMPRARYAFEAILHDGQIYLFGGEDQSGDPIAEVDVYDPVSDTWWEAAPMPTPRSFLSAGVIINNSSIAGSTQPGVVVAGGRVVGGVATAVVEEYIFAENSWSERTPLDRARHSAAGVAIDQPDDLIGQDRQIWMVGGQISSGPTQSVVAYTHDLSSLRHLTPMPEGRFAHGAAALNGRIYLFGGRHEGNKTTGWAFDPETESYTDLPELPGVQNGLVAAAVGDKIYAIGGTDQFGNPSTDVLALDPVLGEWEEMASMPSGRSETAVAVRGEEIYVIGGNNNGAAQTVEIYTPKEDSWRSGPVLPAARKGAMAAMHDGVIYIFGGVDSQDDPVTSVLRLGPADASWETVGGVSLDAAYGSAVRVGPESIVVFGGRDSGGLTGQTWSYHIPEGITNTSNTPAAYDRSALIYHHGKVYLFGGNSSEAPGPAGESTVQKFNLHGCVPGTTALVSDWCDTLNIGFLDGEFPAEFTTGGNADWFVTSSASTVGSYSIQSGNIGHNQITWVEVEVYAYEASTLFFDWLVSSEGCCDRLFFCANMSTCNRTTNTDRIAGSLGWVTYEYEIPETGFYTFRWGYGKDHSAIGGNDLGRLDNIRIIR